MNCSQIKSNYENMNFDCYRGFCDEVRSVLYSYPKFFLRDYSLTDKYNIDHVSVEDISEADDWEARHASCQEGETVVSFRVELIESASHYSDRTKGSWFGAELKERVVLKLMLPIAWFIEDGALEKTIEDKVTVLVGRG